MHTVRVRVLWADVGHVSAIPLGPSMLRRRDREAEFEAFFLANYDTIAQSVAFVCGDRERADDATQEAFIKAYARWGRVSRLDNAGAWVRRVAIHASRDAHRADTRRARREERVAPLDHVVDESITPDSALELLADLPDRQRASAALFYLDDMSIAEISDVLDVAEGTVRFHLNQARNRLRDHLGLAEEDDHAAR